MQSISLKRQVAIKAIVTENFKSQASSEIQAALQQLDLNLQQLEFQGKRAMADLEKKSMAPGSSVIRDQIEQLQRQIGGERERLLSTKNELLQRMNVITGLEIGSEFLQGMLDNYVAVNVGDNLYEKLSNTEVIVKDGLVVEIRGKE